MKHKASSVTAEDIKQFVSMYTKGYTIIEISKETGWCQEAIRRRLHKAGINLHHTGERRDHT